MKRLVTIFSLVIAVTLIYIIQLYITKQSRELKQFEAAFAQGDMPEAGRIIEGSPQLDWKSIINRKNKSGLTYLMGVVSFDHTQERTNFLLSHGADVNVTNDKDWNKSPLMYAVARTVDARDIIKLLLSYGARINYVNANGNTALSLGIQVDIVNENNIDMLLKNGINPNVINNDRKTALDLALIKSKEIYSLKEDQEKVKNLVALLRSYGALMADEVKHNDSTSPTTPPNKPPTPDPKQP